MKIEGIDPVALNRIQENAVRQEVKESERPNVDTRTRHGGQEVPKPEIAVQGFGMPSGLEEAVDKLNIAVQSFNKNLKFQLHEDSNRWAVQVVDIREDEIIQQIPSEEVLNVVAQIQTILGVLLDDRR